MSDEKYDNYLDHPVLYLHYNSVTSPYDYIHSDPILYLCRGIVRDMEPIEFIFKRGNPGLDNAQVGDIIVRHDSIAWEAFEITKIVKSQTEVMVTAINSERKLKLDELHGVPTRR